MKSERDGEDVLTMINVVKERKGQDEDHGPHHWNDLAFQEEFSHPGTCIEMGK